MAPRRKTIGPLRGSLDDISEKENNYLRSLSDYQARVRRRESLRNHKNVAEQDLEQKLELETKIKEGSCKLLAAARHPAQCLEAARAFFVSTKRMSSYVTELQQQKRNCVSLQKSDSENKGKLSISDLRFPLMWRDSDHFKNRGDSRRFAVFCIARIGAEIYDTGLIYPIDREQTDISFPDVLLFNNVPAEFELTLEVYSHVLQEDFGIANAPRRIKRSIHSSLSKTVGRKLAASLRYEYESNKIPRFDLVAYAKLTLDDTDGTIRSHDLTINSFESKIYALPLFGHFCCRLAVQPYYIAKEACTGFVIINSQLCWARLLGFQIEAWKSKKHLDKLDVPIYTICANKETIIQRPKSMKNQLRIINHTNGNERHNVIEFVSTESVQKWYEQISIAIKEHARWKHTVTGLQQIPNTEKCPSETKSVRNSLDNKSKRHGSLYDETPLIDNVSEETKENKFILL